MGRAALSAGPALLTLAAIVVVWQVSVVAFRLPSYFLPAPTEVLGLIVRQLPSLLRNTQTTVIEVAIAFALSVLIGVPVGIAAVRSRLFGVTLYPLIVATQAFPKLAIAPLFTVWFGFGIEPKVAIAFLIAFFPIVLNTAVGIASIDPQLLTLSRSIGLGRLRSFFAIQLPAAAPSIFGGLKIASTFAVIGAVVGEFIGAQTGLGHVTVVAGQSINTPLLFAALVLLTVLGLLAYGLVTLAERVLIPWHVGEEEAYAARTL